MNVRVGGPGSAELGESSRTLRPRVARGNLRTMDADPRAELQRLAARLPEAIVPAALRAVAELAAQRDPFLTHVLAAEEDDEELNEVGQRMLKEARADSEAGRTHTLEEVGRELGR